MGLPQHGHASPGFSTSLCSTLSFLFRDHGLPPLVSGGTRANPVQPQRFKGPDLRGSGPVSPPPVLADRQRLLVQLQRVIRHPRTGFPADEKDGRPALRMVLAVGADAVVQAVALVVQLPLAGRRRMSRPSAPKDSPGQLPPPEAEQAGQDCPPCAGTAGPMPRRGPPSGQRGSGPGRPPGPGPAALPWSSSRGGSARPAHRRAADPRPHPPRRTYRTAGAGTGCSWPPGPCPPARPPVRPPGKRH